MTSEQRIAAIRERLTAALSPTHLEVIDESDQHVGHAGAASGAGHFAVTIASNQFTNKNLVNCHRIIYAALADLMPNEIHALKIKIA